MQLWKIWTFSHATFEPCVTKGSCRCRNVQLVSLITTSYYTLWWLLCGQVWPDDSCESLPGIIAGLKCQVLGYRVSPIWDGSLVWAAKSACGGVSHMTLGSTWTISRVLFCQTLHAFMKNWTFSQATFEPCVTKGSRSCQKVQLFAWLQRVITHCGGFYVVKFEPMILVSLCPAELPGLYASSWDTVFHPFETDLWFFKYTIV